MGQLDRSARSALANTCEFGVFFFAFLPFAHTTTKLLWHPLRVDPEVPIVFRAATSLLAVLGFYGLLSLAMLNAQPNLLNYADVLVTPCVFMLVASLLVYLRTRSWTDMVVIQSLLLALIFSQRLPSLAD